MSLDPTLKRIIRPRWPVDADQRGASEENANRSEGLYPLELADLPQVVTLFRDVFPGNPLSHFGPAFLHNLLSTYVAFPSGCGFVCLKDGLVVGFVVGADDSRTHRRDLIRERWASLLRHTLSAVARSPATLRPLGRYLGSYLMPRPAPPREVVWGGPNLPPASLSFLGVATAHRRSGLATVLTDAFLQSMTERGAERVKLVVAGKNHGALRFYLRSGWRVVGCYPAPSGDLAYRLVYDLANRQDEPRQ